MNIKELSEQAGLQKHEFIYMAHELDIKRFAELVAATEREKCAELAENIVSNKGYVQASYVARAIRARGEK